MSRPKEDGHEKRQGLRGRCACGRPALSATHRAAAAALKALGSASSAASASSTTGCGAFVEVRQARRGHVLAAAVKKRRRRRVGGRLAETPAVCVSVGPDKFVRDACTGGSLDGTSMDVLVVASNAGSGEVGHGGCNVTYSRLSIVRFDYRSKDQWAYWGPKKIIFLIRDIDGPAMTAARPMELVDSRSYVSWARLVVGVSRV